MNKLRHCFCSLTIRTFDQSLSRYRSSPSFAAAPRTFPSNGVCYKSRSLFSIKLPQSDAIFRFTGVFLGLCAVFLVACSRKQETGSDLSTSPASIPSASHPPTVQDWVNFSTGANIKTLALETDHLWLGMPNGVIRYDTGTEDTHEVYTTASTNGGLLSRGIYIIKVGPKGNKWIGTYGGGLTKFDGKTWKTYTVEDGLGDQWVYDIVFDRHGKMWVATWKGVSVFDGKSFTNYEEKDGLADKWVYAIALDHDGIFWFGTESGLSRFDPNQSGRNAWTTYNHEDGLGADLGPAPSQTSGDQDQVVTGIPASEEDYGDYDSEAGGHHMDPSKRNIGPNPNFVIAALVDQHNHKWFGTWGAGLTRFDGKTWKTYTDADGLGGNFIHSLAVDQENHLWAGTSGGASWFDGEQWHNFDQQDGLLNNNVFSLAFDQKGRRWFGTWEGLSMFQGKLPSSRHP